MSDDKTNRGPQDRSRTNVNESYELAYWAKSLAARPANSGLRYKRRALLLTMSRLIWKSKGEAWPKAGLAFIRRSATSQPRPSPTKVADMRRALALLSYRSTGPAGSTTISGCVYDDRLG